jgi:hypothetical protein
VIEAAWLLAAIELNGALVSRGAMVALTETLCAVEFQAIAPGLSASAIENKRGDYWVTQAQACSYDESNALLKVRLTQESLASKTLRLSESSGTLSIALLHNVAELSGHTEFASQPAPKPIPSAAFDLFAGSGLKGLGAVLAAGPWSLQALHQAPRNGAANERMTAEYFFVNGAQIRIGDFRTDYGVEQSFGEFRGISLTNRAAPLRGDGKAQGELAIESPSRVQFFDRNGIPVYSSEILPPGNYQIQGYGASTIPGFLEARLIDVNGNTQSISIAWSADRRLMSAGQTEWEFFSGYARTNRGSLGAIETHAGRVRYGITQHITGGLHAEVQGASRRWAVEASSRNLPSMIGTAALGQSCSDHACAPTWLLEGRADLRKKAFLIASVGRYLPRSPQASIAQMAQLSLSGSWSARFSGSIYLASERRENGSAQHSQTLSANVRLSPQTSLQLQARRQALPGQGSSWVGSLGLSVSVARLNTSASTYLQQRSRSASQASSTDYTVQVSRNSPSAFGPQISLGHTEGQTRRSDAYGRYASRYGDASARTDSLSSQFDWSVSTRLWITSQAISFAPSGEHNLVIHQLGLADVKITHTGNESQHTDASGKAVFRKSPAWTDSRYAIDTRTMPFGVNLGASAVKIPLATHRAYLVDYRDLWTFTQSWQITNLQTLGELQALQLTDRHGKAVYLAADGYVDVQNPDQLPLTIKPRQGQALTCDLSNTAQSMNLLYCRGISL